MGGVSAILSAAGASTRMGRPKPLLPWAGATLMEHQVLCLTEGGCDEVVVVLGHRAAEVTARVRGPHVKYTINADYALGKASSIRVGLRAIDPNADAILLLAIDQPRTAEIVSAVIRSHRASGAPITSPRFQGRGGHPLIFDAGFKPELEAVTEEGQGVREVFQRHRAQVNELPMHDPMVRLDINTPQEYKAALAAYATP